ncbi:MAG: LytR C-terminal domain-containing protein [Actinomycetota bacterium]
MLDRLERSDVLNATALAVVLLLLGFGLLRVIDSFSSTVDEGLWAAEGGEDLNSDAITAPQTASLRPPNEITVRVGNGSEGRQGLAGRATGRLTDLGYGTLDALNKEGQPIDDSFVYYIDGYKVEAIEIAGALNIDEAQVRPLLGDPGLPTDGADVIVVLGQNAEF